MKTIISCTLIASLLVACGGGGGARQAGEPRITSADTQVTEQGWPTLGQGSARFIRIELGPDTFTECRKTSPKFPFDSATTYAQDHAQIAALATCLNAPGMRDRKIILVGRADPQGTSEYNEELGMKRAAAIKQILVDNGIPADRIETASGGESQAKGDTPEQSAGYDRRVDIVVQGGTHAP